jgi:hypothetical protein
MKMIDRQWVGDIGFAILLALPTVALSRPQSAVPDKSAAAPLVEQAALVAQSPTERRFSMDG